MTLRWKLMTLYALVLTGVIGGFSGALVLRLGAAYDHATDAELEARARAVGALVEVGDRGWEVDRYRDIASDFSPERGRFFLVQDERGRTILASRLAQTLGWGRFPPACVPTLEIHGRPFRQVSLTMTKGPEEVPPGWGSVILVRCGQDMTPAKDALHSLASQLLVVGPLVLLLSLVGGFFIVGRTLRPIDRIVRTAMEIQATDLSRRLPAKGHDELARLAATLNDMFDRLQEAFERQTRFTADASHELRTPLAIAAGNAELALKRPRTAKAYRPFLKNIHGALQRTQAIVGSLLTLARADAEKSPLVRTPVNVTGLCRELTEMSRRLSASQKVSLKVESDGDVWVSGDPERLKELFTNLLTNAIRYNRPGGRVIVRLSREDGSAKISVEDTGIGIPEADLPHIYGRFYRVDKARSRDRGGSGLGLAIVKWIVDAHGGSISVTSRLNAGSQFVVRLPQSKPGND